MLVTFSGRLFEIEAIFGKMCMSDFFFVDCTIENDYKKSCFVNRVFLSKKFNVKFEQINSHH